MHFFHCRPILEVTKYIKTQEINYKRNAARPMAAPMTPARATFVAAAPVNAAMVLVAVGEEATVVLEETMVKLAQVRRVALALWMTIDLSPKNAGELGSAET